MPLGALYANFGLTILLFVFTVAVIIGIPTAYALIKTAQVGPLSPYLENISFKLFSIIYLSLIIIVSFYYAGTRNIAINGLTLDARHRFKSSLHRMGYAWMVFSNLLMTVVTLFLLRPWAAIRSWRYLATRTSMIAFSDLGEFAGHVGQQGNVVASEYADIEWMNIGI